MASDATFKYKEVRNMHTIHQHHEHFTTTKELRNVIAAFLSIIPGLGQIYKGYYLMGLALLFIGLPVAIWMGLLLSLATAGLGLMLPVICGALVIVHAYYAEDRRKHHPLGL